MKLFAITALAATVAGRTHAPNAPSTCVAENGENQKWNGLFLEYGKNEKGYNNINTCYFYRVLTNLAQPQMKRALYFAGVEDSYDLEKDFSDILENWYILTGEGLHFDGEAVDCLDDLQLSKRTTKTGWIDRCEWWCGLSNPIDSFGQDGMEENAKYVIKHTLDIILQLVNEYFSRNFAYEDGDDPNDKYRLEMCERVDQKAKVDPGQLRNRFGKPCRRKDLCGQAVRWIYQKASNFVPLVGEINELSSYQQSWKEDRDH